MVFKTKRGGRSMKYAFFTGATGGLGERCVRALSETGRWTVFAAGMNRQKLEGLGMMQNVIPINVDITEDESVEAAQQNVQKYTDRLDAIVNFAGVTSFLSMVENDSVKAVERALAINVTGMVRVNRIFFEMIYKGHGRIVNCSSEAGWMTPQPFAAPYFLSKRAVEAYSDSLRRELLCLDIPVVKIQPGSYKTNITDDIINGFDQTMARTKYYREVLTKMKPLMTQELEQENDPAKLVKTVLRAMESRHPKLQYRVGTGRLLRLLELLPEKGVDRLYGMIFKRRS